MTNPRDYPDVIDSAETGQAASPGVKMLTITVDGQLFTYGQPGWWAPPGDPEDTEGQLIDEDNTIRAAARREVIAKAKHSMHRRSSSGLSVSCAAYHNKRPLADPVAVGRPLINTKLVRLPSLVMTRLLLLAAR